MKRKIIPIIMLLTSLLSSCANIVTSNSSIDSIEDESSEIPNSFDTSHEESVEITHSISNNESFISENSILSTSIEDPKEDIIASGTQENFFKNNQSIQISLSFKNDVLYDLSHYGGDTNTFNHKYDDIYFPADFKAIVDNKTYIYHDVGVRMKGATSRREIADKNGNIQTTCHLKINFKYTFDDDLYHLDLFSKYKHTWTTSERSDRKDRKFFGLEKLDLKYLPRNDAATNGKTYSQEIYSYNIFNQYNVPAPYARWIQLDLSSETMTKSFSYEAIEPVDKRFLKRNFNESKGDLYKCTQVLEPTTSPWGSSVNVKYADLSLSGAVTSSFDENGYANGERVAKGKIGVEDNYNNYHPVYSLKTNDDNGEDSDFSKMANLINACYSCYQKKAPYSLLESKIDIEEWLNYCAIAYLLGNYDDFRNNCNNYYIYFRKSDGKAVFIPYDYDYSLGLTKTSSVYSNITTKGPFTTATAHGTNSISLFYATIIRCESLSYYNIGENTQISMQNAYKSKIIEANKDGVLDFEKYESFVLSLPDHITNKTDEFDSVRKYMEDKKLVVDPLTL